MAAPVKRSEVKLTPEVIREIEYILPKLKYSVYISHVKRWLENFSEEDLPYAFDFLFFLEYIPFDELQSRIIGLLNTEVKSIHSDKKFVFIPFAKYGKSCDVIIYLITHSQFYKELEQQKKARVIRNFLDDDIVIEEDEVVIFVDDIIASGRSFYRDYYKNGLQSFIIKNNVFEKNVYYVGAIVTRKAKEFLFFNFPEINVVGEERSRAFCTNHSPFKLGYGPNKMKEIAYKYGMGIKVFSQNPNYQPMGFSNCECLIAFDYSTPNNTLPIIWGHHKWYPIFPRNAETRMDQAKEIKKEVAFYLGLIYRLKLHLYSDQEFEIGTKVEKFNSQKDHSLITLLFLKQKKYSELMILQVIGITKLELKKIYSYGIDRKLLDSSNNLTPLGNDFLNKILSVTKKKRGKSKELLNFERKNYIYIPKKFEGTT